MREDEIKRKINTRLFAIEHSGVTDTKRILNVDSDPIASESCASEINEKLKQAWENHNTVANNAYQDGYWHLQGSKFKVFIKKALRKLMKICFGWYIFPIYQKQSRYNGKTDNAVSLLIEAVAIQNVALENLTKELQNLREEMVNRDKAIFSKLNLTYDSSLIDNDLLDYFDFEDVFRGKREDIKERQRQYLPYLKTDYANGHVLELGFGRGEMLELMKENGIAAIGVDCYEPFVNYSKNKGYDVHYGDALTFLSECEDESLNGIVLLQVAEHINTECLYQIIRTGYKKLRSGCYFILETPNPESLSTYINFNVDGTHVKPVHYHTMAYVFRCNGYSEIQRLENHYSRHPYFDKVQSMFIEECHDVERKRFMTELNYMMFSGNDYTIIARK